jgi:hypothetical protein
MVRVFRNGLMVQGMRVNGEIIRHLGRVNSGMWMEIYVTIIKYYDFR